MILRRKISESTYTIEIKGPKGVNIGNPGPHPFVWDLDSSQQDTLNELRRNDSSVSSTAIKELGLSLYNAVFTLPIATAYGKAQASIGLNQGLRIKLQLESPELTAIPWEAMHDGTDFLATKTEYPLVRTLFTPGTQFPKQLEIHGPLHILYVESWPRDLPNPSSGGTGKRLKDFIEEQLGEKIDFRILGSLPNLY